jgi:DNA replication protein DnaC
MPEGSPGGFTTAAALVNELHEARDEKRLLRRQLAGYKLLVVDERRQLHAQTQQAPQQ